MTQRPNPQTLPQDAALIALTPTGAALAARLASHLPGAKVHVLEGRGGGKSDISFTDTPAHLRRLFKAGTPIIGICAAGILIRCLAPLLENKRAEPPVIALAEDGAAIVPLLGGHRGGVALAQAIAQITKGQCAITTAGEIALGLALDTPPSGWRIANPENIKPLTVALLGKEPVALKLEAGDGGWLSSAALTFDDQGGLSIRITHRAHMPGKDELVLHPPVLALGIGCERGVEIEELETLVFDTLAAAELSPSAIGCIASIDIKADEDAIHTLAESLNVPARFFPADRLEAESPRLVNPSQLVFEETGCHGVSEGAALAATGAAGELICPKTKSRRATCAVALSPSPIDSASVGEARGELFVIGIGPGADEWRTPEATKLLERAEDAVGYDLYLDLVADNIASARRHAFPLGAEEKRVRAALELAAKGRRVALISSGDAGIYAMGSLVFELIEREDNATWNRIALTMAPGISALQAASARSGAPLGHDFCTISLSDLLTPWPDIQHRVKAAAEGDFVIAFYNPVSKRRRHQLETARDILLVHRPAETPVVLARNLGRDEETIEIISLRDLNADKVDMLTLVLVGSSQTRKIERNGRGWIFTPRGYAAKMESPQIPPAKRNTS